MPLRGALSARLSANSLTPRTQIVKRFPRIGMSLIAVQVAPAPLGQATFPNTGPGSRYVRSYAIRSLRGDAER
jgi:hypothetical protein